MKKEYNNRNRLESYLKAISEDKTNEYHKRHGRKE